MVDLIWPSSTRSSPRDVQIFNCRLPKSSSIHSKASGSLTSAATSTSIPAVTANSCSPSRNTADCRSNSASSAMHVSIRSAGTLSKMSLMVVSSYLFVIVFLQNSVAIHQPENTINHQRRQPNNRPDSQRERDRPEAAEYHVVAAFVVVSHHWVEGCGADYEVKQGVGHFGGSGRGCQWVGSSFSSSPSVSIHTFDVLS